MRSRIVIRRASNLLISAPRRSSSKAPQQLRADLEPGTRSAKPNIRSAYPHRYTKTCAEQRKPVSASRDCMVHRHSSGGILASRGVARGKTPSAKFAASESNRFRRCGVFHAPSAELQSLSVVGVSHWACVLGRACRGPGATAHTYEPIDRMADRGLMIADPKRLAYRQDSGGSALLLFNREST
jgi:hypothetical protein